MWVLSTLLAFNNTTKCSKDYRLIDDLKSIWEFLSNTVHPLVLPFIMAQKYFLYSFVHFVHICSADSVCYQTLYLSSLMRFLGMDQLLFFPNWVHS